MLLHNVSNKIDSSLPISEWSVSHGTVLSLFFVGLLGRLNEVHCLWNRVKFCVHGVVKGGKVVRIIFG